MGSPNTTVPVRTLREPRTARCAMSVRASFSYQIGRDDAESRLCGFANVFVAVLPRGFSQGGYDRILLRFVIGNQSEREASDLTQNHVVILEDVNENRDGRLV